MLVRTSLVVALVVVWLGQQPAQGQSPGQPSRATDLASLPSGPAYHASGLPGWADSIATITPGSRYRRSGISAALAGRHYRDLWTTPIRVPVVNLQRFAGGLTPVEAHTGHQTQSLRFRGADGRSYQFRSVDKDPVALLAPELQGTVIAAGLQDGVSASFPAAPLVANALLESAGVLTERQVLMLLPDDPALGEFRADFHGVLGLLEERAHREPDGGVSGKVISPTQLFHRLDAGPDDRVDARAFLAARLMDMLMGDRDRHRDQFRWAATGDGRPTRWVPISRDHDEAFVKLDGPALAITRLYFPPLVSFGPSYPGHVHLNWHAREIDRRFLVDLQRGTWDSVATALQARLTDAAIDSAVRRMPAEMYPVGGERLARDLRARRDGLEKEALSYYAFLAREVDSRATDATEVAEITRVDAHHLEVALRRSGDVTPYLARRFDDRETREVRLLLWGGDDQVVVRGDARPAIRVRVVGGAGDDRFADSTRGGTRFYDDSGANMAEGSRRIHINAARHVEWVGSDTNRYPPREWGSWLRPVPWLQANSDLGLFVGAGLVHTSYGFRRSPFATEVRGQIGWATGASAGRAELDIVRHPENAAHFWRLHARASGIDVLRYYGAGNDTRNLGNSDYYRVKQQRYDIEPSLVVPLGHAAQLSLGIPVQWWSTGDNDGRLIAALRDTLLGGRNFGQIGGRLTLTLDTRDRPANPRSGVYLAASGQLSPAVWDVPSTYGSAEAEGTSFLSARLPGTPTLALRAGGRKVWGSFPFFESAFLGGSALSGYRSNRFAGDASIYGEAQLRLTAGRAFLALPGLWGVYGGIDAGRVYLDGKSPGGWHHGGSAGVWLSLLDRRNTISLGIAASEEETLLQAGTAFGF